MVKMKYFLATIILITSLISLSSCEQEDLEYENAVTYGSTKYKIGDAFVVKSPNATTYSYTLFFFEKPVKFSAADTAVVGKGSGLAVEILSNNPNHFFTFNARIDSTSSNNEVGDITNASLGVDLDFRSFTGILYDVPHGSISMQLVDEDFDIRGKFVDQQNKNIELFYYGDIEIIDMEDF